MKAITLEQGLTELAEIVSFRDDTEILRELKSVNYSINSSVPTRIPHHHAQHLEHLNIEGSDQYVEPLTLNNHNGSDT